MVKDVGSPKSTSLLSSFHIGSRFCFFPADFVSSTCTDKNNLFHDVQRDIPNLECSPSNVSIGFSRLAFPIVVLPEDDRTDFAQEERNSDLRIFSEIAMVIFHFDLGVLADAASAACPAHPSSLAMTSITVAAVICDADEPCPGNTTKRA